MKILHVERESSAWTSGFFHFSRLNNTRHTFQNFLFYWFVLSDWIFFECVFLIVPAFSRSFHIIFCFSMHVPPSKFIFHWQSEKSNMHHLFRLTHVRILLLWFSFFPYKIWRKLHFLFPMVLSALLCWWGNTKRCKKKSIRGTSRTCRFLFPMVSCIFSEVPHKILLFYTYTSIQIHFSLTIWKI